MGLEMLIQDAGLIPQVAQELVGDSVDEMQGGREKAHHQR